MLKKWYEQTEKTKAIKAEENQYFSLKFSEK